MSPETTIPPAGRLTPKSTNGGAPGIPRLILNYLFQPSHETDEVDAVMEVVILTHSGVTCDRHLPKNPLQGEQQLMLWLAGPSAITPAKRDELLNSIRSIEPNVEFIDAIYIHLINPTTPEAQKNLRTLGSGERVVLDALLAYGDDLSLPETRSILETGLSVLYVTPRSGSISPWSSKATDIARMCTLSDSVARLERGVAFVVKLQNGSPLPPHLLSAIAPFIHDRMTQTVSSTLPTSEQIFMHHSPRPLRTVELTEKTRTSTSVDESRILLAAANKSLGLALSPDEIDYLVDAFIAGPDPIGRPPTDAELFIGAPQSSSLFQMIRNSEHQNGKYTISAYSDNAAVFEGYVAPHFSASSNTSRGKIRATYKAITEDVPVLIKVETHNHPTAVSPFPGAATGSGGEIRDEGAVGRGSKPKAGLSGFSVSNLLIPGFEQPWETDFGRPSHVASALEIMKDGPLGASAFNNEFGRPALTGYFRTFAERIPSPSGVGSQVRGYHKPIMVAGGLGNVRPMFAHKTGIEAGAKLIVLGGPGMLIGLGGGAASSQASGTSSAELDFASVQRENPEMQRRCQQVIDACVSMAEANPIQSIHDVGAGGLSNALPELVHDSNLGAIIEIRDILVDDVSMSPMEIWCNESQERYVLAVGSESLEHFKKIAERERCPYSIVGVATEEKKLIVTDRLFGSDSIHLQMSTLFGKAPKMLRSDTTLTPSLVAFDNTLLKYLPNTPELSDRLAIAVDRTLHLPAVSSKSFLITIGDRSITGLVTRDQMVGPWQVPVADVAVTRTSYGFDVITGEAMAMGERAPLALLDPASSARMAIAESVTNIAASSIENISRIKLSANWMCAASYPGEGAALFEAVKAVGLEICPALGLGIPVGKDSMSMAMKWRSGPDNEISNEVVAPLSLIVTAFAPVKNVEETWTPQLRIIPNTPTVLVFVDLALGKNRLGGSALAQVFKTVGSEPPDVESPPLIRAFFEGCQKLRAEHQDLVLAYHDRSDGGLLTTIAEMCFAGRVGVDINLDALPFAADPISSLFSEELGVVMQVRASDLLIFTEVFTESAIAFVGNIHVIGKVRRDETISVTYHSDRIFESTRAALQSAWAETSYRMQSLRDDPVVAKEEFDGIQANASGLFYDIPFAVTPTIPRYSSRPLVAILREQGINGHVEMAWAFTAAGFTAVDVHMSDILSGQTDLSEFRGIAACGGFSYGDVLGAGNGWAKAILLHAATRAQFEAFFARKDTFALAVCNGCQLFSHLRGIIPGANTWPLLKANKSQRFEARVAVVQVVPNEVTARSVFLRNMANAKLPVPVAHGEGRAAWDQIADQDAFEHSNLPALRYVDGSGQSTETYPLNPNGSPKGLAGFQTPDGRVLALMPHPERAVTRESNSWYPKDEAREWGGLAHGSRFSRAHVNGVNKVQYATMYNN
ncbi:hypothetical protein BS47DRAFT_1396316 [Hydnum rufescens UP504]|uniref:Phosphoribosylformylglycinamidine synthase n=1 Tax=Hydnum rufescens UP504 TaxID=1448309 RepID=A0A9P6AQG4_9AGAM|nr:hypothetical protein BS47DRAFT_1396316 [Hydnum rufescens UP504]